MLACHVRFGWAILFCVTPAFAKASSVEELIPEEPPTSFIRPLQSGFRTFEGSTIGIGAIRELTQFRTREKYSARTLGFILSFDQRLHGPWSGGVQAKWSQWTPNINFPELEPLSPVSILSRVEFSPPLSTIFNSGFSQYIKPFGVFGLGYVSFLKYFGLPLKKDKHETSEPIADFGAGVRFVMPGQAALRISAERWRSLRTFNISVMSYQMEVQFGDVSR